MRSAIEMNPYELNNFVWIDFGIWYMIRDDQVFTDTCMNIAKNPVDPGIRIACGDCCNSISWFFLGSIFGGDRDSLLKFADLVKNKCIQTIQTHGTIMWEINVWLLVYREDPTLFRCYRASHDASILRNY